MNLKRSLIGLFVLFFLISGIGFGLLVLDDQNDLSSRAAVSQVRSLKPALPGQKLAENDSLWVGENLRPPLQISFDKSLWLPPRDRDLVFFHQQIPITVRVFSGAVSLSQLSDLLGNAFTSPKLIGLPKTYLEGWKTQSYSFQFFGTEKIIDVWSNGLELSFIVVMPDDTRRSDVSKLIQGVSLYRVQGISSPDDSARLAAQVRPSVVMVVNRYCAQIKYIDTDAPLIIGKPYPFCLAQAGSGFFVNQNGYIATNGHVVTNLPESTIIFGVSNGSFDNFLIDYFQAYLSARTSVPVEKQTMEQKIRDAHKSKEIIYQMASLVSDLLKKNQIKIENSENHYYVQLGNTPIQMTISDVNTGPDILPASFVDADYKIPDPITGFSSSDVALLKIAGQNYPALPLGNLKDVSVGSDVLVVGFPGVVMGSQNSLLDTTASEEPTFTKGVVSAFKQAKGNQKKLIQTDASINHGNSGGPAVSSDGKVIGIATYGLVPEDGSGNYNLLRDIADLKDLMAKNHIPEEIGSTYPLWTSGLENYWISYFRYAKKDLEQVTSLYPQHPSVQRYLSETQSKINTAEDKTPKLTRTERFLFMNISGGVMAFSVLMIVILSILNFIDSKRSRVPTLVPPRPHLPSEPIQTF